MGKILFLSGRGDLAIDRSLPVNQVVEYVKTCKSGLIQVRDGNGGLHSVPKSNLDTEEICMCDCHQVDRMIMHCFPCCSHCDVKYITEDNMLMADKVSRILVNIRRER